MPLYKALYEYKSDEVNDLYFQTNDVIEYLTQSSPSWYKGRNLMTGKIGLFPYNFVCKVDLSDDEDDAYVFIEDYEKCLKGAFIIATEVLDDYVIGYLSTDSTQELITVPLKSLLNVKEKSANFKFTKCIANTNSNGDSNQLPFQVGDTIWMIRKIDDFVGVGIINGNKGTFSLQSVDIDQEETSQSIDRKNRWIALFDYNSDNKNDLRFVQGEKLKFLDRIDNNWMLMQNQNGQVGMVPFNFIKNISIKAPPQNQKSDDCINTEDRETRSSMPLKPIFNELTNHQKNRISYNEIKRETQIQDSTSEEPSFSPILLSNYNDTDENSYDCDHLFIREPKVDSESEELPNSLVTQFEKREHRVECDMEVLMNDITSIKNQLSRHESDPEYLQLMTNNLSFLKEEYKERQKQLSFIRQQRVNLINGIHETIDESDYCSLENTDEMEKKYTTRTKAIEEMIETENKFFNDLKLTLSVFNPSTMVNKISDQDYNSIFGDLEAVISVSERFYSDLLQAMDNDGVDMLIGSIFLKFLHSFETVYKEYCINYDRKLELINKKPKCQEIEDYLKEGLKKITDSGIMIACIDAMLVKPLQRFLKYPLFMKTIIQNTNEGHIDINDLQVALIEFERIAKKINEKKRFEELRTEIFERNGQWHQKTLHAIQKVPKRLLVASLYGSQHDDDIEYRDAVTKFKNLKKCVAFFLETSIILRDNLKEVLMMYSAINEDLSMIVSSEVGSIFLQYVLVCKSGESNYYKKYISVLDSRVINPLMKLLDLFSGPKILIKKRKSKFLDYLGMKQKMEDKEITRVQAERMEELKNQYLAINNTLKEELSILTTKSSVLFNECLANYLQLTTSTLQSSIAGLRELVGDGEESIEDEQRNCRNKQSELLNRLQKNMLTYSSRNDVHRVELSPTNPRRCRSDSVSRTEYYCQTEDDIVNLKLKFETRNLAYVKKDFIPTKPHQIYVTMGNLVGIIKRCDPQGHASSWLVEICLKRVGFVPRSYLNAVPFIERHNSNITINPVFSVTPIEKRYSLIDNTSSTDLMQFSTISPGLKSISLFEASQSQDIRVARFDFKSTGQTDISMQKNDQLKLIESHDKTGNTMWSLVKNLRTGAQGYVPTNYMAIESR